MPKQQIETGRQGDKASKEETRVQHQQIETGRQGDKAADEESTTSAEEDRRDK